MRGFLVPKLALVSNILLMVAILMWRPRGLYAGDEPMMILSGDPPRSRVLSAAPDRRSSSRWRWRRSCFPARSR